MFSILSLKSMKERSGRRPNTDLAVKLSSALDVLDNVVLLASKPSCCSCNSTLFATIRGVFGWELFSCSPWTRPSPPILASWESIHVERLTTRRSFRRSSCIEVSCFSTCGIGFRSSPAKSAVNVKESKI